MAQGKTQLQRLIFIDRKIREGMASGTLTNCNSMAAEYEVSRKTILRDVDYLKYQREAPVEYDPVKKGYFYTEENFELPAISVNESDLFAICIARKALKQHENTPVYNNLLTVFRKIEEALPDRVTVSPSWLDDRFTVVPEHHTEPDPRVWETVATGLRQSRRLSIDYQKAGAKEATPRQVDPYHAMSYQGEWYLIGYCHSRRQVLTFAVSRMARAELRAESFAVPADFDHESRIGGRFGAFGGERQHQVRIWFSPRLAPYAGERQWHASQAIERGDDGSLVLTMTVNHLQEVKRWLLSWGSGARALAPPELVDEIQLELRDSLASYQLDDHP